MIESVTTCLKKSFTFSGRTSRSEYCDFHLFYTILFIFLKVINIFVADTPAITLLLLPTIISLTVRRLHDVNKSGWWVLIGITIIGCFFPLCYWCEKPGTNGDNDYGKNPE
jgi:uncharacterized membrane protein YhaH (DUF805 family)